MQNQKSKRRIIYNVAIWILTVLWLCVIFYFSSMPSNKSDELTSFVIKLLKNLFGIEASQGELIEKFGILQSIDFFVRKTAHLTEYAVLGVLSFLSLKDLRCAFLRRRLFKVSASLLSCLMYAASDEIHQMFVPGRNAAARDVLIDFCGSVIGVVVCLIASLICQNIKFRKRRKNDLSR